MVERVETDIDEIVRLIRSPGWQETQAGERPGSEKSAAQRALQVQATRGCQALREGLQPHPAASLNPSKFGNYL